MTPRTRGRSAALALAVALALGAACGGAPPPAAKKAARPAAPAQPGVAVKKTQVGGAAAPSGPEPDEDVMPLESAEPGAPAAQPAAEPGGPPRPPAQDLPADRRDALVRDNLRKGVQALRARDADGTVRAARGALDLDEQNVEAMIMLAHGYYLKGYDDKVEAVLSIAQKQRAGDGNATLWMLFGLTYDRTSREDQALAAYEKATRIKADYLAALNNRGAIYLKRHRYVDAIPVFEQVVQIEEKSPRGHTNLGSAYRGRSADLAGRKDQREALLRRAEKEYKLAIQQDPAYAPASFDLGLLYLDADPFPGLETLARYQQALRLLSQYKQTAGPSGVAAVDDHLAAAQKGIEREQKLLDRKKKKDAADKARKPAPGGKTP